MSPLLGVLSLALLLGGGRANAKGGSSIAVTKTAAVAGTVVYGNITIANAGTNAATATVIKDTLEVRYPSGYPAPALPAGVTPGYFVVATVSLPLPGPVPPLGTVVVPYSIDTCGAGVNRYPGAKDMRNVVRVTLGTQVEEFRTANFVPPSQSYCPVCGNGVREGTEQCDGGTCCTIACRLVSDGAACTDGNACTQTDRCQSGHCMGGNPVSCPAPDQCHSAGTCSPTAGTCSNPARQNGAACNDNDPCSTGDSCANGQCVGAPVPCSDGNPCTTDSCSAGACVHTNNTSPCDDGNMCSVGETCQGGVCLGGSAQDCTDHKECTGDACDDVAGCAHTPTPTCEGCFADECLLCRNDCTTDRTLCNDGCWAGFWSCLAGCTSTYCAPFCQADLSVCLGSCPVEAPCWTGCETGNGCGAGCTQP